MKKTRFTRLVRIDEKQLNWLKENKDCKTVAGFLDKIINEKKMLVDKSEDLLNLIVDVHQ